jgi:hypothetical protein
LEWQTETATAMCVQYAVIARRENITVRQVATAAKASSGEVSERITRTRVGELNLNEVCFMMLKSP